MSGAPSREGTPPTAPRTAPSIGWAYAAAGTLAVAALLAAMNPSFGLHARAWPWRLPRPPGWSFASATTLVFGAGALALFASAVLRAGADRALVGLLGAAIPVVAFGAPRDYALSAPAFVLPLLAGVLAGALYGSVGSPRPGAGGRVAPACALVLGAMLLYPTAEAEPSGTAAASPWLFHLVGRAIGLARDQGEGLWPFLVSPPFVAVVAAAVLCVLGAVALTRRSRGLAWGATVAFVIALLWPVGYGLVVGWTSAETIVAGDRSLVGLRPAEVGLRFAADALLGSFAFCALGAFGVTADLVRHPLRAPARIDPSPAPAAAEPGGVRAGPGER